MLAWSSGPVTKHLGVGEDALQSSGMNGMEPPSPLVDGGPRRTPLLHRFQRILGGLGIRSMAQPMPFSPHLMLTTQSNGCMVDFRRRRQRLLRFSYVDAGFGAVRRLRRNVVSGLITLNEPSTGCASKPITVTEELVHMPGRRATPARKTVAGHRAGILAHGSLSRSLQAADRLLRLDARYR